MMFRYFNKLSIALLSMFFIISCCKDCPCDPDEVNDFQCSPREVTVTQFNSDLQDTVTIVTDPQYQVTYYPVPEYSIHTFQFPNSASSTGNLPNDERFSANIGIEFIPIATLPAKKIDVNSDFTYAIIDSKPSNKLISGDMLVDSIYINGNDRRTYVRFRGIYAGISERVNPDNSAPIQFLSESSYELCEYIESNESLNSIDINDLRERSTLYGENQIGSGNAPLAVTEEYNLENNENPVVLNSIGQVIIYADGTINSNAVPAGSKLEQNIQEQLPELLNGMQLARETLNQILDLEEIKLVRVELQLGDVFYYRAVNGKEFIGTVINIDQRSFGTALKKRLSIMFNAI